MTLYFNYEKPQVIQALRYHFISRREIKLMLILVNVFALLSITLYMLGKISSGPFLIGSTLWIILMVSFFFLLPHIVYRRAVTFKHEFSMDFDDDGFTLRHQNGSKHWEWSALKTYLETPNFFHLYFDTRSFFLVPKSGCKDADEVYDLRQLIKKHVPK